MTVRNILIKCIMTILVLLISCAGGNKRSDNFQNLKKYDIVWAIKPQFKNAGNFSEGMAAVEIDDKWGFINKEGKIVIKPQFYKVEPFYNGMAAVVMDYDKWGFVNKEGKLVVKPQFEEVGFFNNNMAPVKINNKWGFINNDGKMVIKPQYENARSFSEGLAAVKINSKTGFINKEGKMIIEPQSYGVGNFINGITYCNNGRNITREGMWFDKAYEYKDGYTRFEKDGKYGFLDSEGRMTIEPRFDAAGDFYEGLTCARTGNKCFFIDKKGRVVLDLPFDRVTDYNEGMAAVYRNKKWGYINKDGKMVIEPQFDGVEAFHDGIAIIRKGGYTYSYGLINKEGKILIKPKFDGINYSSEGCYEVRQNHKYGFIDKKGNLVIDPQYSYSHSINEGIYEAENKKGDIYKKHEGHWAIINKDGKVILEITRTDISSGCLRPGCPDFWIFDFYEGFAIVCIDHEFAYISREGMRIDNEDMMKESTGDLHDFSEGMAAVCDKHGKYGYIKNPIKVPEKEENLTRNGLFIGEVKSINNKEIIIGGKDIAYRVNMGDTLCLYSDDDIIILRATFPMQTVSKCEVISGNRKNIKTGTKVYKYIRERKKDNM